MGGCGKKYFAHAHFTLETTPYQILDPPLHGDSNLIHYSLVHAEVHLRTKLMFGCSRANWVAHLGFIKVKHYLQCSSIQREQTMSCITGRIAIVINYGST
jgi:hypothetical protein